MTYSFIDDRSPLQLPHAHPDPESEPKLQKGVADLLPSRHIIFPFNLRQNRKALDKKAWEHLWNLFPDTKAVWFDGYFLVFTLGSLPEKPWPITIAGVQPYFTTDLNDDGPIPPIKRASKIVRRISAEVNLTDLPPAEIDAAFELVINYFSSSNISITEVQYWNVFFVIVLESEDITMAEVPSAIGHCACYYLYEKEMSRPQPAEIPAQRILDPTGDVVDNSEYEILRPGVMLGSEKHPIGRMELRTTSGVLVEDGIGERYMTVASRGFPHGDRVFQPSAEGRDIGKVIMEVSHTGVALVKLNENVRFVNETFETTSLGVPPARLEGFIPANETRIGSPVYMNNPFTGFSEGTCGPHARLRIPSDDPHEVPLKWIRARWVYMGQGFIDRSEDGACGSAIWNDDGQVLGFFRYASRSEQLRDWSFVVASDNLIEKGFKITAR
ncbi:uncharacterized protein NFIA_005080 [Aspergillus fischeri NRRL 181]|uniref:Uncharacterized protein n=1 Tax=Neosartorya fischeri (strain ATCC 1020 / DSM 3700 / CBS 544.65 / FGSC A1164 / JCM 1740 / NRRL 181 / WB 181) TaxID=331117 RepID=A1DKA7_NEOFI|nr:uncharacterized protein NFIA_005080 [Aspergillus fischeri NRRL 181]EAW17146.1 hypothetical protein NFIA_005080 [Aspergillus fischeri NRRL 181]